jgi:hypothetical protein
MRKGGPPRSEAVRVALASLRETSVEKVAKSGDGPHQQIELGKNISLKTSVAAVS